jgi:mannose-6-phosphate isomerase-like protein (cupin superfamily)
MTTYSTKKHLKSAWITRRKDVIVAKPWGTEEIWSGFGGVHGKILSVSKGGRTSLKYHKLKTEVLYLMSGKIEVLFGNESSFIDPVVNPLETEILYPGDALLVQSDCPYRIIALEDSEIIEIGNHSSDKPVRVLDDYGRESEGIESILESISIMDKAK